MSYDRQNPGIPQMLSFRRSTSCKENPPLFPLPGCQGSVNLVSRKSSLKMEMTLTRPGPAQCLKAVQTITCMPSRERNNDESRAKGPSAMQNGAQNGKTATTPSYHQERTVMRPPGEPNAYLFYFTHLHAQRILPFSEVCRERTKPMQLMEAVSLTTLPHVECMEISALSRTYKSTALSSGRVEVKLRPKSMRTCQNKIQRVSSH